MSVALNGIYRTGIVELKARTFEGRDVVGVLCDKCIKKKCEAVLF